MVNDIREDEVWESMTPEELTEEWDELKFQEVLDALDGELAPNRKSRTPVLA